MTLYMLTACTKKSQCEKNTPNRSCDSNLCRCCSLLIFKLVLFMSINLHVYSKLESMTLYMLTACIKKSQCEKYSQ